MKKILFLVTKSNFGGAQRYVFDLATSLPSQEFEVSVAAGGSGTLMKKLVEKNIATHTIESFQRDISLTKELQSVKELFALFKKENPDIIHLNSSKAGGAGALVARLSGIKKIIFTVHGFAFNEDRPWYQKSIIKIAHYLTLLLCTDIICINKKEFNQVKHWPFIRNKIHLIYNGIEQPTFLSRDAALLKIAEHIGKPLSFFEEKIIIGSIGELTFNKGYSYMIEALRDIPNILYIIVGDGELKEKLTKEINDSNQQEKIFLAGYVANAATVLSAFDIFVISSLKEGIPYVLLEAGLAKVPVISTNVGGIPELISPEKGTLVPSKDAKQLKEAVLDYLQNLLLAQEKSSRLQTYFHTTFSLSQMVEKTKVIYTK